MTVRLPRWMRRPTCDEVCDAIRCPPVTEHTIRQEALDRLAGRTPQLNTDAIARATQHYTGTRPLGYHYSVDQAGNITDHTAPPQETPMTDTTHRPRFTELLDGGGDLGIAYSHDDRSVIRVVAGYVEPGSISGHLLDSVIKLANWALTNGCTLDGTKAKLPEPVTPAKPDPVNWKSAVYRAANRLEDLLGGDVHPDLRQLQGHTLDMLLDRLERVDRRPPAPEPATGLTADGYRTELAGLASDLLADIHACARHVRSHDDRPYAAADRLMSALPGHVEWPAQAAAAYDDIGPVDMDPDEGDGITTLWRMRGDLATFNLNQRDGVGRALDAIAGRHLDWLDDWTQARLAEQADAPTSAGPQTETMTVPAGWVAFDPENEMGCRNAVGYATATLGWVAYAPDDVEAIDAVLARIEEVDPQIIVDHVRMRQKAAGERRALGVDPLPRDQAYSESRPVVVDWDVRRPPSRDDMPTVAVQPGQEGLVLLSHRGWVQIRFEGTDDVRRWQDHSVTLNALAFRLAELTEPPAADRTAPRWTDPTRDALLALLDRVAGHTVAGALPSCVCLSHVGPCTVHGDVPEVAVPLPVPNRWVGQWPGFHSGLNPDAATAPAGTAWPDKPITGHVRDTSGLEVVFTVDRDTWLYPALGERIVLAKDYLSEDGIRQWVGDVIAYGGGIVAVRLDDVAPDSLPAGTPVQLSLALPPAPSTRRIVDNPQA